MDNITSSASKLVLLALVGALALLTVIAGVHDVWAGTFSEVTKTLLGAFSNALALVLGFYFAYKGETNGQVSTQTVTKDDGSTETKTQTVTPPPFGGK